MILAALIRKRHTGALANTNPAEATNDGREGEGSLARSATLALAEAVIDDHPDRRARTPGCELGPANAEWQTPSDPGQAASAWQERVTILASLIRKRPTGASANAKPAKAANNGREREGSLAGSATLALADSISADIAQARCWRVRFPHLEPVEVIFAPSATRAQVLAIYPGARVEPLPDPMPTPATAEQAAELRELVALILPDNGERADALRIALADPKAALVSFRLLAADIDRIG